MPVPRLFEASGEPHEQWGHVLAALLALCGPDMRAALVAELTGEDLAGAGAAQVRERQPVHGAERRAHLVLRGPGGGWALAVVATLAFDAVDPDRLGTLADALAGGAERAIVVALTPDRRPPGAVGAARGGGRDVRHHSWLRVRDWVQERPERGAAQGVDLLLLREAEYFLTPRVAELYRLEGIMPFVAPPLRPALASMFFDLNDLAPAPRIAGGGADGARIAFPRTGDPAAEIVVADGGLSLRLATDADGPGFAPEDGWRVLEVGDAAAWLAARGWARARAEALLVAGA